ncbi:integrase domain-containing protein [Sphaerotilus sp.]|uniref:integrase domain-containing protein n=1 Tax=Sphaerotilus sp. TaxID=2093942 RepID=UPI002ACE4BCC|nr:integrase domain-containing protein [Sphaerotilus sp.]MDZ7855744.1 integrase domain-containing protein [Sphaerotilus sp.]
METHINNRPPDKPKPSASRAPRDGPHRTYEHPALDTVPLNPRRCSHVLQLILKEHNWRHSSKPKGVSHKTVAERARFCYWLFDFLRDHPKHFKLDPRSFSGRHVEAVTRYWQDEAKADRMSPATIQTYFSFMKTFAGWIGKAKLLKPIGCYFDDPALYQRGLFSGVDKSWKAQGVNAAAVIAEVEVYDVHAAASLKLMQAFQLRFKESVMFRPHSDVITAAQAGKPNDGVESFLDTHRGTKGGRERLFPIDNATRQGAIAYARRVAVGVNDSVSDPRLTLLQAMRRLRYVMERFGITRAGLGVVPHGLRHQGAAEDFEQMTGSPPPIAGGPCVDLELDRRARFEISQRLGHGRLQIVGTYVGRPLTRPPGATASPPVTELLSEQSGDSVAAVSN